ncbi:MAG: hypothetical protein HY652_02310 [Acidobacteria bacterium]|nr:hypothetical protein [Acidobacteriota bacterium]
MSAWIAVLGLALEQISCSPDRAARVESARVEYDLIRMFPQAQVVPVQRADGLRPCLIFEFARGGLNRRTLTLIANSEVRFTIERIQSGDRLRFGLAMPFNLGDGAQARVLFQSGARSRMLFQRDLDPARRREDRSWSEVDVPLKDCTGEQGELVLQAQNATGDFTGDWIGFAEPEVVSANP